ncbi:MAG: tetratricopeptide repeat protein [Planctomycetota bacterium]|nr:MAG: tetratricopeptide repeat protein [Planctomycetota bacterium]
MAPSRRERHPRIAAAVVALVSLIAAAGCATGGASRFDAQRVQALLDQARSAQEAGQSEQAIALFEQIVEENPTIVEAHMGLADLFRQAGQYDKAHQAYAKAATLEPDSFKAQFGDGLMLHLLGRLTEAVRAYLRALAIDPADFQANLNVATAYLQLGEPAYALPFAQRAVDVRPEDGPARVNLGAVHAAMGQWEQAVEAYQQAKQRMTPTPELLMNLADALNKLGRHEAMRDALAQLLAIEPSAQAWERMGAALFHLGRYDEALQAFRNALEFDQQHYPALNGVGVCLLNRYLSSGRQDKQARRAAVEALRKSLRIHPRQPRVVELLTRYS